MIRLVAASDTLLRDLRKRPVHFHSYAYYVIAWAALGGADLLLVPLLSRLFSPVEYGRYLLVVGLVVFLSDFLVVWSSTAFLREAARLKDPEERLQLRATLFSSVMLAVAIMFFALAIGAGIASALGHSATARIGLAGGLLLPGFATVTFALSDMQSQARPQQFCAVALARLLCVIFGGLLAVALAGPTSTMFLTGGAFALTFAMVPYMRRVLVRRPFPAGSRVIIVAAIRYGAGVWLQNVGAKVLRIGDRYLIGPILGTAAVAVYGAGYTLLVGSMTILVAPLITVLTPRVFAISERDGDPAVAALLGHVLRTYVPVASAIVACGIAASPLLLAIFLPAEYARAFSIAMVAALLSAGAVHGAALIVGLIFAAKRRTMVSAQLFVGVAILNVVGNLLTVPMFGLAGAVWTTMLTYAALLIATVMFAGRYVSIDLPWSGTVLGTIGIVVSAAVTYSIQRLDVQDAWSLVVTLVILIPCVVLFMRARRSDRVAGHEEQGMKGWHDTAPHAGAHQARTVRES
jgi:O-antigen/teichoic acid export membrane protein